MRYILIPKEQNRKIPVEAANGERFVFSGASIIETDADLSVWVGLLLAVLPDLKPEPAPEPDHVRGTPDDVMYLDEAQDPAPEPEPEVKKAKVKSPMVPRKSRARRRTSKSKTSEE